jgi:para-aminobenzoate synthetase component 1
MVAPSVILVEDRKEKHMTVYVSPVAGNATERKEQFLQILNGPFSQPIVTTSGSQSQIQSCFTREEYMQAVEDIRDYIVRGHVYQVNMSQRFETLFSGDTFELFVSMFRKNPAPFYAFVQAGDHQIVSTSPERFIELQGKRVESRPIKGTRPRGATPEEDRNNRNDLANSRKDDAELSMIVDLLRNDIGKVCNAGSVKVSEHKRIEAYENVFHNVSIVEGILEDDKDAVDLVVATFPGGSITGCPKIRSMEIIDELEPVRRHIYTGSIGYISFHETMDLSIAIRTATISSGRLVFSVGGGIVYDSDPADEYQETLHKGKTLMNAVKKITEQKALPPVYAWYNGLFKLQRDVSVSVDSEGFLYGYGIFETIRVQHGKPCRLEEHLARFNKSWNFCFGTQPPDVTWGDIISRITDLNGLSNQCAAVKILAAAGKPDKPETITLLVTARPYTHRLALSGRDGLYLATFPQKRHSHLASHKTTNYMYCKMAQNWAKQNGADEALILNVNESVCETATANILCTINGEWYRPESEHVLPGTMENAVMSLLAKRGIGIKTRRLSVNDLKNADHVFVTNALMGIVPVLCIDNSDSLCSSVELCHELNSILFGI